MPPKVRITAEMIVDTAFALVREKGYEALNARELSGQLHCSTQPLFYQFANMEEIRNAVYAKADQYHSEYIVPKGKEQNPLLELGMNYVHFAAEEGPLFRFLFQSGQFSGAGVNELMNQEGIHELLGYVSMGAGCSFEEAKALFVSLFIAAHGCASLLANNAMKYDENEIRHLLENTFRQIRKD